MNTERYKYELEDIDWTDPLTQLFQKFTNEESRKLANLHAKYTRQFSYMRVIWERLQEDYRNLAQYMNVQEALFERIEKGEKDPQPTPAQAEMLSKGGKDQVKLELDYEDLLVRARILMDILAVIAQTLLKDGELSNRSFYHQKKCFFKLRKPYKNKKYEDLVKSTDWFELGLKSARDSMIVHPGAGQGSSFSAIHHQAKGFRIMRVNFGISQSDVRTLLEIKRRYEKKDEKLKAVSDNFWETIHYFMNTEAGLERKDLEILATIIERNGGFLPDIRPLMLRVRRFLERFAKAFCDVKV